MKKQQYASNEYGLENLPSNRKDQFFDILKHKYKTLLLVGLMCFLFMIPMFAVHIAFETYFSNVMMSFNVGEISAEQATAATNTGIVIYCLAQIVGYLVAFIGLGGGMRIIRLLAYNEGILFWDDFLIGIKQNFKQFLVFAVIFSLGTSAIYLCKIPKSAVVTGIALGLKFGIINPWIIITICYASTYSLSLFKVIKNGFALYVKTFLVSLLFSLVTLVYYFLNFIPLLFVILIIQVLLLIFVLPIFMLGVYEYMLKVFDVNINSFSHPELVNKGLFVKEAKKND